MHTRGFELAAWQRQAVEAWERGDATGPYRGTLEVFTGGGKTLIALACAERASAIAPDLRLAVVVPTQALAQQWRDVLRRHTDLAASDIGVLGGGSRADFGRHRAVVAVLNTAAKRLPELAAGVPNVMLVVDECHRAGAPTFSRVLRTPARFRLGLSATPEREEYDENGEPLVYDEQLVARALGRVVHRFDLRQARLHGWLPAYEIHHHGVELLPEERAAYERATRKVDDAADALRALGVETARAQHLQSRPGPVGRAAGAYVAATTQRKDLLYRASERARVAASIVHEALATDATRRVLLFHERVAEAEQLFEALSAAVGPVRVELEHSGLSTARRRAALDAFRSGEASVLVSVKSLIEGIDVPDADVGVSVASSSSVRQRVQSLGRVLRRRFEPDADEKHAAMHILYVTDTVDEVIYSKADWSDLTGGGANLYWHWSREPGQPPERQAGPPATPKPTEEQEWQRIEPLLDDAPLAWFGEFTGQEYSVDTLDTVRNVSGSVILNPQGTPDMVRAVRGRSGGRFRVTPLHRLVLVRSGSDDSGAVMVAGRLAEPFDIASADDPAQEGEVSASELRPGSVYRGPASKELGTFRLRQKRGGVIERRGADGAVEFALTAGTGRTDLEENARRVVEAWQGLFDRGITFHVNGLGHAWYEASGERRFLADVPGGFVFPSANHEEAELRWH